MDSLVKQLKDLVNQIDNGGPCPCPCPPCGPAPCPCGPPGVGCPPCPYPYAQVCMMCPPPCPAPTEPKYVKPLTLPCPPCPGNDCQQSDPEEDFKTRYANFYNNYNVDYHAQEGDDCGGASKRKIPCNGVTVDGKNPHCEDYRKPKNGNDCSKGCPTGFKPCSMKLCPPPCCDPLGTWKATVQPCPPKPKKRVSNVYRPKECRRPCCKHWKPKGGPCLYDKPCKAHCYDHPPGIKPSSRAC